MRLPILLLLSVLACQSALCAKPNIIFILTDDLGISDLGCYGRTEHRTPHLDQLAGEGARFTASYCAQPICSPSRAAILTGKAPARLHLTTYLPGRTNAPSQKLLHPVIQQQLPLEEETLAERLKANGYATACIGKWHLGGRGFLPPEQGFDVYHPGKANTEPGAEEGGKGEYDLTRAAIGFMETNRTRPFFLYIGHNTPHIPYKAREEWVQRNSRAFEPVYAAVIEAMDDSVGMLLERVEALGLRTNTIVIFTSDNGGLHVPEGPHQRITDNSPFRAGKGFLYEGGLRVPLIVRWPREVTASVIDTPVVNTSWFATLCELAGIETPRNLDGASFAWLLKGKTEKARRMFWHFPHYTNQGGRPGGAVRDGDWKFVVHYDTEQAELYNLAIDPGEKRDLAKQNRERVTEMRRHLDTWIKSAGAQTNELNPAFEAKLFRQLYEEVDVTRHVPREAEPGAHARLLQWRKQMNEALSKPKKRD